jgi:glycosyltransferase involved in cell wall biosynthesis
MVSLLIPTYNYDCTTLVNRLMEQLKGFQFDYEILVFDDASTNADTAAINRNINNHPHCTYRLQEKNLGRTATRQALAEAAKYNWLLFLDADVLPQNENFIHHFEIENQKADVVFGGITYQQSKPDNDKILRWKYGKSRENRAVSERIKVPYLSIISGCCLIKKELFLKANSFLESAYGADVLFAQNLEQLKVKVAHIDNPVVHLGLETNASFIEKTKKGLESLYLFEKENKISNDYRPIQKAYQSLKKNGVLRFFMTIIRTFEKAILKNLESTSPSLFLFDLYRLYYFANLKS